MRVGVPKEIKSQENRVALTPAGVRELVGLGHDVWVQEGAGAGGGFADSEYGAAGARLCAADDAWASDLVVKVKEPIAQEYAYLKGQILFTYLHLAGVPLQLSLDLLDHGTTSFAYETLADSAGRLPLLAPMSAVAGNIAATAGAHYLARHYGGRGVQLGEVLGVRHGKVVVIGDGVVAYHAAKTAWGLGTKVVVLGLDATKGGAMRETIGPLQFEMSTPETVAHHVREADLVIGAVLRRGAKAEHVVTEAMVETMLPGAVIVDVSIDQGGCVETSRPTTHADPVYLLHGVLHYCVANMPGAFPKTSTLALTEATLPYIVKLAGHGRDIARSDPAFRSALSTYDGFLANFEVAEALNLTDRYRAEPWVG